MSNALNGMGITGSGGLMDQLDPIGNAVTTAVGVDPLGIYTNTPAQQQALQQSQQQSQQQQAYKSLFGSATPTGPGGSSIPFTPSMQQGYAGANPGSSSNPAYGAPSMSGYGFSSYGGQAPIPQGGYYNQMAQMMAGPNYAPPGTSWNVLPQGQSWNSQAAPQAKTGAPKSGGAPMGGKTPAPGPGQSLQSYLPTAAGPQANTGAPNSGGAPMGGKTPAPGPGQSLMGGATPAPGPGQSLPSQPIHPALAAALARIHQGMGGGGIRPF